MPELPAKKVGIVTCSGEELPEGTVTRLAALRVLEDLRRGETVTICLPLFLADGEGDRAFAKYYPTIAIDGCDKRCAFNGTTRYSNQPAASLIITDLVEEHHLDKPAGMRKLNSAGMQAVELAANEMALKVDEILGKSWNRVRGEFNAAENNPQPSDGSATCSCGSGIPVQKVTLEGHKLTLIALPLIFDSFREQKKAPSPAVTAEIMKMVAIYNRIPPEQETRLQTVIGELYQDYYKQESK